MIEYYQSILNKHNLAIYHENIIFIYILIIISLTPTVHILSICLEEFNNMKYKSCLNVTILKYKNLIYDGQPKIHRCILQITTAFI